MLPRLRCALIPLLLATLWARWSPAGRTSDARARATAAAPSAEPVFRSLAELHADPLVHLGALVRVRIQVDAELTGWNPYLTRFGSADFRAWRAWGDEQFLWRAQDWKNPVGTLFARRGSAAEEALAGQPRYARFELVGRVRQVFLGRPWIEIESAERLIHEVDEASLVHASRATLLIENERWPLAIEGIDRALAGDLPQHARDELWRLRRECREHVPR